MPTVFELFGLRFFFYSGDHEPIHIHVTNGKANAKIALVPKVEVVYNHGLTASEMKKSLQAVKTFRDEIKQAWEKNKDK